MMMTMQRLAIGAVLIATGLGALGCACETMTREEFARFHDGLDAHADDVEAILAEPTEWLPQPDLPDEINATRQSFLDLVIARLRALLDQLREANPYARVDGAQRDDGDTVNGTEE